MKNLMIILILACPILIYGQADTTGCALRKSEINDLQKLVDSLNRRYTNICDSEDTPTFLDKLIKGLEVRQSFGSADTRKEPAIFQFTIPKEEERSYLIDGAIGLVIGKEKNLSKKMKWNSKLVGEYHRNTLIDEAQHNWQIGISTDIRGTIKRNRNNTYTQTFFNPTVKYSKNVIDSISSLVITGDVNILRTGSKGLNINTYTFSKNKRIIHLAALSPSFEYQNNFEAKKGLEEGSVLRPILKLQYALAGNKIRPITEMSVPQKTFELFITYTARYDIINTTGIREYYTDLLRTGIDYYLVTKPIEVTIGFSFNRGSNPLEGLKHQQFWLFTLSLQK